MQYSKEELGKLVAEVEKEFSILLAKAQDEAAGPLVQADESEEEKKDNELASDQELEAKDSEDQQEEPKQDEEESHDEHSDDDHLDYDDEDLEEMHKMYSSMKKAELKAHYEAAKKALEKCGEMKMAKSEREIYPAENTSLLKSELDAVKKQNEELKKNIEALVASMTAFLTKKAPQRKAITEIAVLEKSEQAKPEIKLSEAEIHRIISEKSKDPSLSKSDRMAIDNYYLGGRDISKIAHLLK